MRLHRLCLHAGGLSDGQPISGGQKLVRGHGRNRGRHRAADGLCATMARHTGE